MLTITLHVQLQIVNNCKSLFILPCVKFNTSQYEDMQQFYEPNHKSVNTTDIFLTITFVSSRQIHLHLHVQNIFY